MRNKITKNHSQGPTMFRRLTRADLITFDREAKDLILEAMDVGCLGRISSKGHCILRNNAGGSTSIPRNMSSPNRTAQNARADMKRLFAAHGNTFSRWFDDLPGGLPADQLLEISFNETDEPFFNAVPAQDLEPEPGPTSPEPQPLRRTLRSSHLRIAPEPGQEAEADMSAQPEDQDPNSEQIPVPHSTIKSPEEVLASIRDALGEDPRVAVLERRVTELKKALAKETERADEAQSRLGLIKEAFHA